MIHSLAFQLIASVCLLTLAACGGGGSGGTLSGGRTSALPSHLVPPIGSDLQRENTAAHDPLDHWYRIEPAVEALNLDPDGTTSALRPLLDSAGGNRDESATRFRNIRRSSLVSIGQRDGITYGQWIDGPAGTLDIDHSWQFAENVPQSVRAAVERAAKVWSRRLNNHFVPYSETYYPYYDFEEPLYIEVDDMLIVVQHWNQSGQSSAAAWFWDEHSDRVEVRVGHLFLAQEETIEQSRRDGHHWLLHIASHETGHMLWHDFAQEKLPASIERHLNRENHTFNGPNSVAEYGGPVPLQWLNQHREPVRPGMGTVDYGHLGPCSMVMSYAGGICGSARNKYQPNELDFAYMADIGWNVIPAGVAEKPEVYGYGAWGEYSAWGVGVERVLQAMTVGRDVGYSDWLQASADAFGTDPNTLFTDTFAGQTGAATWTGSLLGVDTARAMLPPVFGNAELEIQLTTLEGTARFDELMSGVNEEVRPFRSPSLTYSIAVVDNGFADASGVLSGGFYGPAHNEMAGTLDDPERNLLAGFGGVQQ